MRTMRRTFWITLAVTLLLTAAGEAHAQSGPAPGYDDPYAYAADHVANESEEAANDPVGFAADKASPDGLEKETEHAAWLACWTADHETDSDVAGACDAYYTPPEEAAPDQPDDPVGPGADDAVRDRVDDAEDTAGQVVDAANDVANEPGSAPEQVRRIITAVAGFVDRTVHGLLEHVEDAVGFAVDALGVGGGLVGEGAEAAGDGVLRVAVAWADGALGVAGAAIDSAAYGADWVSDSVTAAAATIGEAAGSVGDAVDHTADEVGHVVSDAIERIQHWVTGEPASDPVEDVSKDGPGGTPDGLNLPDLEKTLDGVV